MKQQQLHWAYSIGGNKSRLIAFQLRLPNFFQAGKGWASRQKKSNHKSSRRLRIVGGYMYMEDCRRVPPIRTSVYPYSLHFTSDYSSFLSP